MNIYGNKKENIQMKYDAGEGLKVLRSSFPKGHVGWWGLGKIF
jgi:hypothetical protein